MDGGKNRATRFALQRRAVSESALRQPDQQNPQCNRAQPDGPARLDWYLRDQPDQFLQPGRGQREHQPLENQYKAKAQKDQLQRRPRQFEDDDGVKPAPSRNSKNSLSGVMTSVEFDPFSAFS